MAQRDNDVTGVNDRAGSNEVLAAAIRLGDDGVLRHVDETAGEVARVGRLQGRVGEALAGAVRGDEVLLGVQTLAEVSRDG